MTTIRRINVSQIDGNNANANEPDEIRPFGEAAFYLDTSGNTDKLVLMMFDGQRSHVKSKVLSPGVLYGSNADSGDGSLLDTIKLIPDASLALNGSHQYLVIDPTIPNHIHIRAGGTIDNSSAELFLGGENNNVRVNDSGYVSLNGTASIRLEYNNNAGSVSITDGEVFIKAGNSDGSVTSGWSFQNNGMILFPGSNLFKVGDVPMSSTGAVGDKVGTVAFDSSYFYYCTANYTSGYEATLTGGYFAGPFPSILKGSYPQPQPGWTFIWNSTLYTIVNVTDPNEGQWQLEVDQNIDTQGGGVITLNPPSPHIWKRVAWSGDTW